MHTFGRAVYIAHTTSTIKFQNDLNLTHCTRMKVRENMGPLSPYISQTIGNFETLPDAKNLERL